MASVLGCAMVERWKRTPLHSSRPISSWSFELNTINPFFQLFLVVCINGDASIQVLIENLIDEYNLNFNNMTACTYSAAHKHDV